MAGITKLWVDDRVDAPSQAEEIRARELTTIDRQSPIIAAGELSVSALTVAVFWHIAGRDVLAAWLVLVWASAIFLLLKWWVHRRRPPPERVSRRAFARTIAFSIVSGALWGGIAVYLFPASSAGHQVFLAFVIGGMSSGAAATLSTPPIVALSFFLSAMGPLIAAFYAQGEKMQIVMATMVLLYMILLIFVARNRYAEFLDSVKMRMANRVLLEGLENRVAQRTEALARSERELQEAHHRLTDAIEAMPEGFVLFDGDERMVICNSRYRDMYPSVADIMVPGTPYEDIVRASAVSGTVTDALEREEKWIGERLKRFRAPGKVDEERLADGQIIRLEERRTKDGGTIGVRTDITDLKRQQQALKESEQQFKDFAEAASDWVWETDEHHRFTPRSSKFRGHADARWEDLKGKTRWEAAGVDPEKDERWRRHRADLDARKPFRDFEYTYTGESGETMHRGVSGKPVFDEAGVFRGYRGTATDITELKRQEAALRQSEEHRRLVTDAIPALIGYIDSDQRYRYVNKTYEIWYQRPREEIIGALFRDIFPKESFDTITPYAHTVLSGKPVNFDRKITFPDGVTRLVHATAIPHLADDGSVLGVFILSEDVTQQREMEEQLHQIQKQEAIGQLSGGLAHDFNNILGVILGNLELLEESLGDDKDSRELAKSSIEAALRGAKLTQRLLALARKQELQPRPTDIKQLVTDTTALMGRTLEESIDIQTHLPAGLWPAIIDPGQLENALLNLAINARDAMPDGGNLTIETANVWFDDDDVNSKPDMPAGGYVMIAVSDTGCGMPEDVAARAFEPFFTTKEFGRGSGLGLSMVYGFVKQSGGHIRIYSEEGHGTTVKLYLPLAQLDRVPKADRKAADAALPTGDETILVVEDDAEMRRLAVKLIKELGYTAIEAEDGRSALAIIKNGTNVDLLFTDVVMPGGLTGLDLAEHAQKYRPDLKVLLTSGYSERAAFRQGRLHPRTALLAKPYRKQDLARKVRKVLDESADSRNDGAAALRSGS